MPQSTYVFCSELTYPVCKSLGGNYGTPLIGCSSINCQQPLMKLQCTPAALNASTFTVFANNTVTGSGLFLTPTVVNGGSVGSNNAISGFFTINSGTSQTLNANTLLSNPQIKDVYDTISNFGCDYIITPPMLGTTFYKGVTCLQSIPLINVQLTFDARGLIIIITIRKLF